MHYLYIYNNAVVPVVLLEGIVGAMQKFYVVSDIIYFSILVVRNKKIEIFIWKAVKILKLSKLDKTDLAYITITCISSAIFN